MGREIRRVPAGWDHPRRERCPHWPTCSTVCFKPMLDEDYDTAAKEWLAGLLAWERGDRPTYFDAKDRATYRYFWDYEGNPPDEDYYRPKWTDEERTHYQVYETVSEGTPVTPPFATKEELVNYLVEHGDFWDQQPTRPGRSRGGGWAREAAEKFVRSEWAPSIVVERTDTSITIKTPRDGI